MNYGMTDVTRPADPIMACQDTSVPSNMASGSVGRTENRWKMEIGHMDIVDEWTSVEDPRIPDLSAVTVDGSDTALLILDIQYGNCNEERRPRCVARLAGIRQLLAQARESGVLVVYTLTRGANAGDIRTEVAPVGYEPMVASSVDKFLGTDLDDLLKARSIKRLILVGTLAHGAVLHTGVAAAQRGYQVIVPVDGISSDTAYAEKYTCWHLAYGPGSRRQCTLTRLGMLTFR